MFGEGGMGVGGGCGEGDKGRGALTRCFTLRTVLIQEWTMEVDVTEK